MVRTAPEHLNKITAWLDEYSINQCKIQNGDLLKCEAPARIIEQLFNTELYNLRSVNKGGLLSVTHFGRMSIPESVQFIKFPFLIF